MVAKTLPVIETAVIAWRDAFRAIGAMPVVTGIAFIFTLAMQLPSLAIRPNPFVLIFSPWFLIGSFIVQPALLAPLAIAVHRFVLLGESTNRYPLEPWSGRYRRFVGFAILVKILWLIPILILTEFGSELMRIVVLALSITFIVVIVRRIILFPAIAIDAPGATWSNAQLDTKGSSWRVAFILVLMALPPLVIDGLLLLYPTLWYLRRLLSLSTGSEPLLNSVILAAVTIPTLCAFAAAASRIYRIRADVMTRPSA